MIIYCSDFRSNRTNPICGIGNNIAFSLNIRLQSQMDNLYFSSIKICVVISQKHDLPKISQFLD